MHQKETNKKLQIFRNESIGKIITFQDEKEIWFSAKDVCNILELKNTTMALEYLDEDERTKFNLGRQGETNFITESGLYTLMMRSRKVEAKKFRKWITSEVLPSIRKNGMYATNELLDNPDLAIQVFQELKHERDKRKQLEKIQEMDKPLLDFAKCIADSDDCIYISVLAKLISNSGYQIGQKKLFRWLRSKGYLINEKR